MGHGNTRGYASVGPHATEVGAARSAVTWAAYTVALAAVIVIGLVVVPAVVVWCVLFDAD